MTNTKDIQELVTKLANEMSSYSEKPNKAKSSRVRVLLGELKNSTPEARKLLREADAVGYAK